MKDSLKIRLVVIDLMGNILLEDATKEQAYKFIYKGESYSKDNNSKTLMHGFFVNHKYLVLRYGEVNKMLDKLKKAIIVCTEDKKTILGSFSSVKSAYHSEIKTSEEHKISRLLKGDGYDKRKKLYYLTGQEGVDLLKELGYLNKAIEVLSK